ncbi:hypothetical protein JTB14_022034 [Gonioctena quinquepunctata]|nr:hypothetical protein JTB14_022034 [Gonioctena quinquepunctata]
MIPFSRHDGIRKYVPWKPNPIGLKNYVLASPKYVILDYEINRGKTTNLPGDTKKEDLGTGGRAVLRLSKAVLLGLTFVLIVTSHVTHYFTSSSR